MRDKKCAAQERQRRKTGAREKRSGNPNPWQEAEAENKKAAVCAECGTSEGICTNLCPGCPGLCEIHCKLQ